MALDRRLENFLGDVDVAISMIAPIETANRDQRAHAGRLKNLLKAGEAELEARAVARDKRAAVIAAANEAIATLDLRKHRPAGVAVFATPEGSSLLTLPQSAPEALAVGHHFHVKPLLGVLDRSPEFVLLALSVRGVQLWSCDRYEWRELELEVPGGLPAIIAETDYQRTVDSARDSKGRGGPTIEKHAFESPDEVRRAELMEYLRRVADAVEKRLANEPAPIVLASYAELGGHFRGLAHLPRLLEDSVALNPGAFEVDELHARAVKLLEPKLRAERDAAFELAKARLGTGDAKVAIRLEEILAAAHDGRIDTLLAAEDASLSGAFDPDSRRVTIGGNGGGEDLLNLAVVKTLAGRGRVLLAKQDELPRKSLAVALMRY